MRWPSVAAMRAALVARGVDTRTRGGTGPLLTQRASGGNVLLQGGEVPFQAPGPDVA